MEIVSQHPANQIKVVPSSDQLGNPRSWNGKHMTVDAGADRGPVPSSPGPQDPVICRPSSHSHSTKSFSELNQREELHWIRVA